MRCSRMQGDTVRIRLSQSVLDGTEILDTTPVSFDTGSINTWALSHRRRHPAQLRPQPQPA